MYSRFRIATGLALLAGLLISVRVLAGGWAVITVDELPMDVVAGKPLTIGFTVLQHGKTPMTDLSPTVTLHSESEKLVVLAEEKGKPGHYEATLNFPSEGTWNWSIQAFTMDQVMPALSVSAPDGTSSTKAESSTTAMPQLPLVAGLSMGVGMIGLAVALLRKNRPAMTITTLCLLVGAALALAGTNTGAARSAEPQKVAPADMSQLEYGQQLFIVKGCITCHHNAKIDNASEYWTIDMGATNLSTFTASEEALRLRLKDPKSVKSDTKMPNLNLSEAEIEALIVFINSK